MKIAKNKTTMNNINTKTLYDADFALWIEDTVNKLKKRDVTNLDWENLIDEVESLGKSEKRRIKSLLYRLFEHLLKRKYTGMQECYRGWDIEIRNFKQQIEDLLEDSPSLKNYLKKIAPDCYEKALKYISQDYEIYDFSGGLDTEEIINKLCEK